MAGGIPVMPLTGFQADLLRLLSVNRSDESHLAGGAALHHQPQTPRFSNDLDIFHDTQEAVAAAYRADLSCLKKEGVNWEDRVVQPGFIRGFASLGKERCKIEWCHDSCWRFLPVVVDKEYGRMLHPLDLAVNKLLALVGRDEPRDFLDVLFIHQRFISIGGLVWAAAGKDPGLSPGLIHDLLARKGRFHAEDFNRLDLSKPVQLQSLKKVWLQALEETGVLISQLPPEQVGCLYFNRSRQSFESPRLERLNELSPHFAKPGGVLPQIGDLPMLQDRELEFEMFLEEKSPAN